MLSPVLVVPPIPLLQKHKRHPSFDFDQPEANQFEKATRDYCDRFQLYWHEPQRLRLYATQNARLGALMYPKGSDELLQVGMDFCIWAFAFDDEYCDEGAISTRPDLLSRKIFDIQRAMDVPEDPPCTDDRYALAARDMRIRLQKYATPLHAQRFADAFRTYMMMELHKSVDLHPTLNDYVLMRFYGGGGWAFAVLSHIIPLIPLPEEEYTDRRVRALAEMLTMVTVWDTEPYSYAKEQARAVDDREHNLIQILMRDHQCTFAQAMERFLDLRWRVICLYQRLSAVVFKEASQAVLDYFDALNLFLSGGIEWDRHNHRYRSVSGLELGQAYEGGEVAYEYPAESFEAVDLPSIAWWWRYDPARTG
ncbi:terpene synthase family protein [Pseudomonas chlororaphis]|uniref:terpene synthase family protein n=1 Tax=Pseudomonas chlororaphis TaxID=587753 RepID=UPI0013893FD4|nr:terpene synthase family protein [Pseudomonas chlororaphis]